MLSKIPSELLLTVMLITLAVAILAGIIFIVRSIITAIKAKKYNKLKFNILSVLCVIIAAASWLLNLGWMRFFLTLIAVPFIHAIVFFCVNNFAATYAEKSKKLKICTIISYITYLISYLLLPDGGDTGGMYVFFGLINNETITNICFLVCSFAVQVHIIFVILQIAFANEAKKEMNKLI